MKDIKNIIKPENGIESAIVGNADFITGCMYGKIRNGHPEGQVIYHIQEVLANIDKFYTDDEDRQDLRLIAILHDTFKYKVDQTKPKSGENHHGWIAAKFAEKFTNNIKVLQVIQCHDDAYNAWQKGERRGDWYGAERRANELISKLLMLDCLNLFIKFYHCDNATGDKTRDNYKWFLDLI